jgi:glycosyltransferase involved in cell wall biosynthesis
MGGGSIEDGVSGVLVPQDDADGFAKAIAGLSAGRGKLKSMSLNARERAKDSFGLDRMIDGYLALFDEVALARPKAYAQQLEQDQPAF